MTTSQNGWPIVDASAIDKRPIIGIPFPQGVLAGDVRTVLAYVAEWLNAHVEAIHTPGCWGYDVRKIKGGSAWSNHSSGTAIDYNAPRHPQGKRGTWTEAQVHKIHVLIDYCGGVVRWGGDYHGTPDEMHFEIVGDHAQVAALARKINGTPAPLPATGKGYDMSSLPLLKRGATGPAVNTVQVLGNYRDAGANVAVDGHFGPNTEALVKRVQQRAHLAVTGQVDTHTWAVLLTGKP